VKKDNKGILLRKQKTDKSTRKQNWKKNSIGRIIFT